MPAFRRLAVQVQHEVVLLHRRKHGVKGRVVIDAGVRVGRHAEATFLPTLLDLHRRFPKLRIVLEHCTTADAVEAVKQCGPTVAATITAHHLFLTIDQWADNPHCFCKPVAKLPSDRAALLEAATSGDPKFFLGTDSAPHPKSAKIGSKTGRTAAGVFTQPYAMQYVATAFERMNKLDKLQGFACDFGRTFYKTVEKGWEVQAAVETPGIELTCEPGTVVVKEMGNKAKERVRLQRVHELATGRGRG